MEVVLGKTIYSFKGIPYAEPPVNERRFRPSSPHNGWTGVLVADRFGSTCPQPSGSRRVRENMSEDCLFLNLWTTAVPRRPNEGRLNPVVIFLEGQLFTLSNPSDFPAEDLVSDQDVVFVSVSYRVNAFGFLSWEDSVIPGNLGLLDQYLAILWVYTNIGAFGGNRNQITLMGHSSGAASAMYHVISSRSNGYIQRTVLMSGSILAPWAVQPNPRANAERLARSLNCHGRNSKVVLRCLQRKKMSEIVAKVDEMIRDGNSSAIFAPVFDDFLTPNARFLEEKPEIALKRGSFRQIPMMIGFLTEEGVLMAYFLKESLDRLNSNDIGYLLENTVIPAVLSQMEGLREDGLFMRDVINFEYFDETRNSEISKIYDEIIRFFTDVYFLAPLLKELKLLARTNHRRVYFYVNRFKAKDIFGNKLNKSSASHGSDLLYLFGPSMYQKFLLRSYQYPREERLSRNFKAIFGDFFATGRPSRALRWDPFEEKNQFYYEIDSGILRSRYSKTDKPYKFWYEYLPLLADHVNLKIITDADPCPNPSSNPDIPKSDSLGPEDGCKAYATFTWLLLSLLILLLLVFLFSVYLVKKQASKSDLAAAQNPVTTESIFSINGNRMDSINARHRSRWREAVTDYRL